MGSVRVRDLREDRPVVIHGTPCGRKYWIYRSMEDGKLRISPEFCYHKGLSLEHARVDGSRLICAGHGWIYEGHRLTIPGEPISSIDVNMHGSCPVPIETGDGWIHLSNDRPSNLQT